TSAAVLAFLAGELLGIDVKQVVSDEAQLVTMHARRRAEFGDLVRLARVGDVVDGEALRRTEARAADRADIGKALAHLDDAAAAEGGRRIVAEQAEVLGFFWQLIAHSRTPGRRLLDC